MSSTSRDSTKTSSPPPASIRTGYQTRPAVRRLHACLPATEPSGLRVPTTARPSVQALTPLLLRGILLPSHSYSHQPQPGPRRLELSKLRRSTQLSLPAPLSREVFSPLYAAQRKPSLNLIENPESTGAKYFSGLRCVSRGYSSFGNFCVSTLPTSTQVLNGTAPNATLVTIGPTSPVLGFPITVSWAESDLTLFPRNATPTFTVSETAAATTSQSDIPTPTAPPIPSVPGPSDAVVIAPAVVGGVFFLIALIAVVRRWRSRSRQRRRDAQNEAGDPSSHPSHDKRTNGVPNFSRPVPASASSGGSHIYSPGRVEEERPPPPYSAA